MTPEREQTTTEWRSFHDGEVVIYVLLKNVSMVMNSKRKG